MADLDGAAGERAVDAGHPGRVVAGGGAQVAEPGPLGRPGELERRGRRPGPGASRRGRGRGRRSPCWWRRSWVRRRACPEPRRGRLPTRAAARVGGRRVDLWTTRDAATLRPRPRPYGAPVMSAVRSVSARRRSPRRRRPSVPGYVARGAARRAAAPARCGGRCPRRRWRRPSRSRCSSPATRSGRRARRRCSASSTIRTWSGCIEVVHQPRRGGAARVALVLELLAGGSLAALLARRGRLRPGEVVTAIAPGGGGARPRPRATASSTATSRRATSSSPPRAARCSPTSGWPGCSARRRPARSRRAYVDPTVARGGAPGPASDVFGVAAAAFHALTGIAPWNAATPADTLARRGRRAAARPRRAGPGGARRSCSPSSAAGWPPIRTTAGRRRRSRWTCGTPAARSRCGCRRTASGRRARPHRPRSAHRAHPPGARPAAAAGAGRRRARRRARLRAVAGAAWPRRRPVAPDRRRWPRSLAVARRRLAAGRALGRVAGRRSERRRGPTCAAATRRRRRPAPPPASRRPRTGGAAATADGLARPWSTELYERRAGGVRRPASAAAAGRRLRAGQRRCWPPTRRCVARAGGRRARCCAASRPTVRAR